MATWTGPTVNSSAVAINIYATAGTLLFQNTAGAAVGTAAACSATFSDVTASGVLWVRTIGACTATGSHTLGTVILLNSAGNTVGSFTCSTAGTVEFVFAGGQIVGNTDQINVTSWTITCTAS
jgi:hypothetical protein